MPVATTITDTQGIVAIVAAAMALVALVLGIALWVSVRRLRRAQRLVLGDDDERDVVAHAAGMQDAFEALRQYVDDAGTRLDGRLAGAESALRGTIAHRALVRYDAYNELSGRQSVSVALLDDEQSGIVLSCIHHRDQARVYLKQMLGGQPELELSPEEAEAVRLALASRRTGRERRRARDLTWPAGRASDIWGRREPSPSRLCSRAPLRTPWSPFRSQRSTTPSWRCGARRWTGPSCRSRTRSMVPSA